MKAFQPISWALKSAKSKNMNFRLTSVAQKRLCLSSLFNLQWQVNRFFGTIEKLSLDWSEGRLFRDSTGNKNFEQLFFFQSRWFNETVEVSERV